LEAASLTSGPERFEQVQEVWLFGAEAAPGEARPVEIESVWEHRGRLVFKFRGFDSISDAERLKGADVRIPLEERAPLAEGEYYQSDLVGCEVIDRRTAEKIGVVTGWQENGGPSLLEVDVGRRDPALVPFARGICTVIDVPGRRILADLPEGLLDLVE
jgi:16S rRNA processing protein RimM